MAVKRVMKTAQAVYRATQISIGGMQFGDAIFFNGEQFVRQAYIDARDVDKLHNKIKSFRVPLKMALDEVVVPAIIKNFAQEGRPPWVALKDSTKIRRSWRKTTVSRRGKVSTSIPVAGGNFKILDQSGRLKKAATQKNMWDIKENQLTFRSTFFSGKVPYGAFHQLGTRYMPQRVFISLRYDDEEKIQEIFNQWLFGRLQQYWTITDVRD